MIAYIRRKEWHVTDTRYCRKCGEREVDPRYHSLCSQCRAATYSYAMGKTCPDCGQSVNDKATRCRKCAGRVRRAGKTIICEECGTEFYRPAYWADGARFCSNACRLAEQNRRWSIGGANSPNWKGGRHTKEDGYVAVYVGKKRRVREHVLIAQEVLGRPLRRGEVVHHINLCKTDNRHCNLLICTQAYHRVIHHLMAVAWAREHLTDGGRGL